jgi:hypothetical protein
MSGTRTYSQALNVAAKQLPKLLEDQYSALACNLAMLLVWDAADWHESVADLPPFYLQGGEQDHGAPLPIVPEDFRGLRRAAIQDHTGRVIVPVLANSQNLNETWVQAVPTAISFEASRNAFRLYPRVPSGFTSPVYMVTGTYKKTFPEVTNETLDNLLPLEDNYFFLFVEALRWAFWQLSSNTKDAGTVVIQDGRKVYTGQLGVVMNMIDHVVGIQETNNGEHRLHPAAPLVRGRYGRR